MRSSKESAPSALSPGASADGVSTGTAKSNGPMDGGSGRGTGDGLPHHVSELYADVERALMLKMHADDKQRFRAIGLSGVLLFVWVLSMFGTEIRRYFASKTAEVAKETLKVEALQVQTQELATALVQALLNDHEVVRAGALFLREASTDPETQEALVSLALYILQHPDTLNETHLLVQNLLKTILGDAETVAQLVETALMVLANPRFQHGASQFVVVLGQSEEVYTAVAELSSRILQDPRVLATFITMLTSSSHKVPPPNDLAIRCLSH